MANPVRTIERFEPRVLEREWGQEIIVAATPQYLGKVLKMKAETWGGLQHHVEKDETFHLFSGEAIVRYGEAGELQTAQMSAGQSFHVPAGADHQVIAVTDCVFFEASTPHYDDRVRVESRYGLAEEGGLPTTRFSDTWSA